MILFVGDNDESLAHRAKAHDQSALLIHSNNVNKFLAGDIKVFVAYTALADLPKITEKHNVFFDVLDRAGTIYYCPPHTWSDQQTGFDHWSSQRITEYTLYEIHRQKNNVHGLDLSAWSNNAYIELADLRQIDSPQLWIAGCSIPHGVGVEHSEKIGSVLSKTLSLPVSHLTKGSSGIPWAADQILRSDIRSGDTVVWLVTSEYRFCYYDKKLQHLNPHTFQRSEYRSIGNNLEDMLYRAVTAVHQVMNFCEKIQARLIVLPTLSSETLRLCLHACPHWHAPRYHYGFVDLGSDGVHPGPQQHAEWADFCLALLQDPNSVSSNLEPGLVK